MDTYGLIGYPLAHSFSAEFFNKKFTREGIRAEYLNFECEEVSEIQNILNSYQLLKGLNVTIPHKEKVISYLDKMTPEAMKIGAVNTIRVEREKNKMQPPQLVGHNTDYIGFKESIYPLLEQSIHKKALVLGTGGASKAVVYALEELGIHWKYVSRTPSQSQFIYSDLTPNVLSDYTIIVNTSPVGTYPNDHQSPNIPYKHLTPEHLLYDLVYNPEETLFLRNGKERGATIKNGAEMLERQALAAWDFWNE